MNYDPELVDEFIAESKEHIENIEKDLLDLEHGVSEQDPETINRIFRSIHSIKGVAGFVGFYKIKELSHSMESLLQKMRDGEITTESKNIDPLLAGIDLLNRMLNDAENSNDTDIRQINEQLRQLIGDGIQKTSEINEELDTDASNEKFVFNINESLLEKIPESNDHIYVLKYNLNETEKLFNIKPDALFKHLMTTGIILDSEMEIPSPDTSQKKDTSSAILHVLYTTLLEPDLITNAIYIKEDQFQVIKKSELKKASFVPVPKKQKGFSACLIEDGMESISSPEKETNTENSAVPVPEKQKEFSESLIEDGMKRNFPPEKETNAGSSAFKGKLDHTESIRINVDILDKLMTLAGELVLVRNQQLLFLDKKDSIFRGISQRLDVVTTELQETIMKTRMQTIGKLFSKLPRIARDLSKLLNKKIDVITSGNDVELDKTILESLADPFTHIIRNCCDHGIEPPEERSGKGKPIVGKIEVMAFHEAGQINIVVKDDGKGIDPDAIRDKILTKRLKTEDELGRMNDKDVLSLIMMSGFSTVGQVSEISGRGVGMDVVKTAIDDLGGTIELESRVNKGTTLYIRLPLTLAIISCLVVEIGQYQYAIPQVNLEEIVCLYDDDIDKKIEYAGDNEVFRLRNHLLQMVRLNEVFGIDEKVNEKKNIDAEKSYIDGDYLYRSMTFVVVKTGSKRFGLIVDKVIGNEEIVVKPMHGAVKGLEIYSGATVMGDGRVALILDVEGIARNAGALYFSSLDTDTSGEILKTDENASYSVLLFKSGDKEQFAVLLQMIRRIERIDMSKIEKIGDREFITNNGTPIYILRLDKVQNVSACSESKENYLLIPKFSKRPYGILVSEIVDIVEGSFDLTTDSYLTDGCIGTSAIMGHMSLFLDVFKLIELAETDWFDDRKNNVKTKEGKHILVIEKNAIYRQLIKKYLETEKFRVTNVLTGKDAIDLINSYSENGTIFDMFLSDIELPFVRDGDFIRHIRSFTEYADIPAIGMSAYDTEENIKKSVISGFDKFAVKLDREQLLTIVNEVL